MVKNAFEIFYIIIGLAFSSATYSLYTLLGETIENNKATVIVCYGVIFFFTVPRFFFGNLIFYDRTHEQAVKQGSIKARLAINIIDFYWCLAEFLLFFFVGFSIKETSIIKNPAGTSLSKIEPDMFIWGLLIISIMDVVWHGMVWYGTERVSLPHPKNSSASGSWAVINIVTGVFCAFVLYFKLTPPINLLILAVVYAGAFIADFIWNPMFYLESKEDKKNACSPT